MMSRLASPTITMMLSYLLSPSTALDTATCIAPLGMESGAIPDSKITASSTFEHASVGAHNARARVDQNGGAWCPRNMIHKDGSEWLELDLTNVHVITATETMGRFGNGQGAEFAESYLLEYWRPRLGKWVRYRNIENREVMEGNSNTYLASKESLSPVVLASKLRFHPYSSHQRTICMRVEAYGCLYDGGLVSYSMTQGDKRGSGFEFYDWNYDGEWGAGGVGGSLGLKNGLGSLTDGNLGPSDYKLSYYAKNRGWVGWKNENRDFVEIIFEFAEIQEFYSINIFCNNQFTREVSLFKDIVAYFSIGGEVYAGDPVVYTPIADLIFEDPRNVTTKLHRRVGRFVKIKLYFSSKWILISEVSFDSSVARGNYSVESIDEIKNLTTNMQRDSEVVPKVEKTSEEPIGENHHKLESDTSEGIVGYMPIIVGALATVIILLAALIFFIISRTRGKRGKRQLLGGMTGDLGNYPPDPIPCEKIAMNCQDSYGGYGGPRDPLITTGSDSTSRCSGSGSQTSGGSGGRKRLLDNNFNSHQSPLPGGYLPSSPRTAVYSSHGGSCYPSPILPARATPSERSTPQLQRRGPINTPTKRIISNPLAEAPPQPLYMEPYQVMRYQQVPSRETAILYDASCGEYAVPLELEKADNFTNTLGSETSLEKQSDYAFLQENPGPIFGDPACHEDSYDICQVLPSQIELCSQISCGSYGTVHLARVTVPPYSGNKGGVTGQRLCVVKYMQQGGGGRESEEFLKEVQLLSGLRDENISRVLGAGREDGEGGSQFVVMEYLEFGDLTQFLQSHLPEDTPYLPPTTQTLNFPTLMFMATQVSSGMKYLESLNFVHRDLATRNCLVGKSYQVKICDFGSDSPVYRADYFETTDKLLIPLRWMTRESVVEHRYTTKSDVWSFGVCLWEILNFAGIRPYSELTDIALLTALEARALPPLPAPRHCHKDVYELMIECWNMEETLRPSFREIHLFLQRKNLGYSPM